MWCLIGTILAFWKDAFKLSVVLWSMADLQASHRFSKGSNFLLNLLNLWLRFFPHGKWLCFHSVSNVPPSTPPWVPYMHIRACQICMTDMPLSCTIDPCKLKPSGYGSGELFLVASSVNRPLGVTQSHISHTHSTAYILPCTTSQTQFLHHAFHACHIVNGYLTTLDG